LNQYDPGQATIQPNEPVVAGSFTTVHFTYTCGHPIDDSGFIKITFRSTGDAGALQFDELAAPNYCTVSTTGDCLIEPRWDPKGHIRPWSRALFLKIRGGFLDRGEKIEVVFGDTIGGSPGWQMQTHCAEKFEFKTFVDPIATYQFKELPVSPTLEIIPGEPDRAICVAPSQVKTNQSFSYYLKLEDRWGNPTGKPRKFSHPGYANEGVQRVLAEDVQTGLAATSNPILALTEDAELRMFWADFHGQSGETIGDRSIEAYFGFARDHSLLDIAAHSANDFQVSDEFWDRINHTTRHFYQPGAFVTFPGYEWSGNTPLGGDRNVYFASEGGRITRSSTELLPGNRSAYQDSPTAAELFQNLAKQPGPRPFTFAHVGGRYANMDMHDPEIELAVEIHSAWGTFEWILEEALARGYRLGICANSDDHKCRPGASYPGAGEFGSYGGLTCVLAPTLDRESILAALRARHFYATTGTRSLVNLKLALQGKTFIMGDVVNVGAETPQLQIQLAGSSPIDLVEIRNGMQVVKRLRPYEECDLGRRVKIVWSGARVRGRDRLVNWDGGLEVQGNSILAATPLNFWNANHPLERIGNHALAWKSVTTGSTSGVILTLERMDGGTIKVDTLQGKIKVDTASIGLEPKAWDLGGLKKEIRIYRLPDRGATSELAFSLPLTGLHAGDNPIYLRMVQEDEHVAWTSPIYLVL
jgi:hypothetical protein